MEWKIAKNSTALGSRELLELYFAQLPAYVSAVIINLSGKFVFLGPNSSRDLNKIIEFQCEETLNYQASLLWGNKASVQVFKHVSGSIYQMSVPLV